MAPAVRELALWVHLSHSTCKPEKPVIELALRVQIGHICHLNRPAALFSRKTHHRTCVAGAARSHFKIFVPGHFFEVMNHKYILIYRLRKKIKSRITNIFLNVHNLKKCSWITNIFQIYHSQTFFKVVNKYFSN